MPTEPIRTLPRTISRTAAAAATLAFVVLAAGSLPTLAQSDPGRPTSNRSAPPSGGGGGGSPDRKVALGVSMQGDRNLGTLDAFTASIGGNRPALWSVWSQWGNTNTREFPTALMNGLRDRGVKPFVFWEPWDPFEPWGSDFTYARIDAGVHDAYIRRWARDAAAFGGPVLLRFAHEANGNQFPWAVNGGLGNTIADYKRVWNRIWSFFRQEGATNVKLVWTVSKEACPGGCNPYVDLYPGDYFVDYVGFSSFNWGNTHGREWTSMYDGYRKVTSQLDAISDRPIIVAETATNDVGGDKPQWIRDGYREVFDRLPNIVAILYLNYDLRPSGHPDWSLANTPGAVAAYREIAGLDQFKGRFPFNARRNKIGQESARKRDARAQQDRSDRRREERSADDRPKRERRVFNGGNGSAGGGGGSGSAGEGSPQGEKARRSRNQPPGADEPVRAPDTFQR